MKKIAIILMISLFLISGTSAYAVLGWSAVEAAGFPTDGGSWTPGNATKTQTHDDSVKKDKDDLKILYDEFQRFWVVKDTDDLQDRFEDFLKTKSIYPKEIENYDEFMETWVDHFDEDLEFDDLYDIYDLDLDEADDLDEYDVLLDDDVDDLYDDYLDDYIDEEYYEEYGEYFDEFYYD